MFTRFVINLGDKMLENFRRLAERMIRINQTTVEKFVYKMKEDGFGGTIVDVNSSPDVISENVRFINSADYAYGESSIGFSLKAGKYILMQYDTRIEENDIITEICTGDKYKVGAVEPLITAGNAWAKRAKVEKVK
jgi:hypothetical protein